MSWCHETQTVVESKLAAVYVVSTTAASMALQQPHTCVSAQSIAAHSKQPSDPSPFPSESALIGICSIAHLL